MTTTTRTKTCSTCLHWNETGADKGECRRQPPQAVSFRVDEGVVFETRFPETHAGDWCGEFQKA